MKKVLLLFILSTALMSCVLAQTTGSTETKVATFEDSYVTAADAATENNPSLLPGETLPPDDEIYQVRERRKRQNENTGRVLGNVLLTGLIITTYMIR